MINNTTCQCAACRNMSRLDLKLFVHFGDYAEQSIAGRTELGGPEVIVVHRLMKNTIREATGVRAYAAFTEAAVAAISVPEFFADRPHHTELIEQLGDCELTIIDMQPLWQDRRGRETVVVPEDDIWVEDVVGEIAVPPDRAWHLITDPQRRSEWMHGIEAMTRTNTDRGRMAAGAIEHCAHGGGRVSVFTIVDVRPYDHFTFDVAVPFSGSLRQTFFLTATEKGTRITVRTGTPRTDNALTRPLLKVLAAGMAKTVWSTWVKSLETLAEIAQNEPPGAPGTHPHPAHVPEAIRSAVAAHLPAPGSA